MDFISQYLKAHSGTMVIPRYTMWSALSVLATTMGRRIFVDHGHYQIHPNLYIAFVGRMGLRKSLPVDQAQAMITETFPDYPVGASVMSREQIVGRMCSQDCFRTYIDGNGNTVEWRPLALYINELENFMSINPPGMVSFLTDIYDRKLFKADTIKHGLEPLINPCINLLACATPDFIVEKLKMRLLSGGIARRLLFVYEIIRPDRITFPVKSKEAYEAEGWCKEHLRLIVTLAGEFKWSQEGRTFFDQWFRNLPAVDDKVLEGFYEAKDVLVTKVAMLIAVANEKPELLLTKDVLTAGVAFIESIEENLPKLTIAVGRNELAVPQHKMLQLLVEKGGWMSESTFHRLAALDMAEWEYSDSIKMLKATDQIHVVYVPYKGSKQNVIVTPEKYEELKGKGEIQ